MAAQLLLPPDEFVTLEEVRDLVPGDLTYQAIHRWVRKGLKVFGTQDRIRLRTERYGQKLYTTRKWLREFAQALTDADAEHWNKDGKLRRAKARRVRLDSNLLRTNLTLQAAGIMDDPDEVEVEDTTPPRVRDDADTRPPGPVAGIIGGNN